MINLIKFAIKIKVINGKNFKSTKSEVKYPFLEKWKKL